MYPASKGASWSLNAWDLSDAKPDDSHDAAVFP
jgi:hypothetical protein